jgi:hypothetical protein
MIARVAAIALTLVIFCAPMSGGAQKPVREEVVWVDGTAAPTDIGDMKAMAEVVVLAQYSGKQRLRKGADPTYVETNHTFELLEIFKKDATTPGVGQTIEVVMRGGVQEFATYTLHTRVHEEEPLIPNRRYVLFLQRLPGRQDDALLRPAWGNAGEGVFEVTGARVRPQSTVRRDHRGMPTATFLAELRK